MERLGRSEQNERMARIPGGKLGLPDFLESKREGRSLRRYKRFSPNHYTVLVVDSESAQREKTTELLRSIGFRVAGAGSATEALEVMVRRYIDVVVCDMDLPDLGGCEMSRLLKSMRCVPADCLIPVILLSESDEAKTSAALRSGADLVCLRERAQSMLVPQVLFLLQ